MSPHSPLVSIVIPCHNYGRYLEAAIDSCLHSTFTNFEIIVVNDGSTDPSTIQLLKRLNKPKTRVLHQAHKGVAAARNTGIRNARGNLILPLDADDKIHPTLLAKEVSILRNRPKVGFVSSWLRCFGNSHSVWKYPPYNFYRLLFKNHLVCGSLFRKIAWKQVGGYNKRMKGFADWDFWISLGEKGWMGHIIPEPLFLYRKHGPSMSTRSKKIRGKLVRQIRKNHPALYTSKKLAIVKRIWQKGR